MRIQGVASLLNTSVASVSAQPPIVGCISECVCKYCFNFKGSLRLSLLGCRGVGVLDKAEAEEWTPLRALM